MHIFTNVAFLSVFCALDALSPTGRISPFGAQADGTLPGEGIGLVALKRLDDARRDRDRVYATLRAVGSSTIS